MWQVTLQQRQWHTVQNGNKTFIWWTLAFSLCQADDISDLLSLTALLSPGQGPLWAVGTLQSLTGAKICNSLPVDLWLLSQSLRTFGHTLKHYLFMSEPWAHLRFFKVCAIQILSLLYIIIFFAHWYFIPRGLEINKVLLLLVIIMFIIISCYFTFYIRAN